MARRLRVVGVSVVAAAVLGFDTAAQTPPEIKTGEWTYAAEVVDGERRTPAGRRVVKVERLTLRDEPAWRVTGRVDADDLQTSDQVFMSLAFAPLSRELDLGIAKATLEVDGEKALGTIEAEGRSRSFKVAVSNTAFLNYYSLRAALTAWPIDATWTRDVDVVELRGGGSVVHAKLAVDGEEKVDLTTGAVDCWKLRLTANGIEDHYWLSKDGAGVVRVLEVFAGGPSRLDQRLQSYAALP
jgi:hypothetical protein